MARSKAESKDKSERLLILTVDIDNDLYRKTKISGPLIGRVQNLSGASQLALADPQDPDANAIFYSVKLYDQLKEEGYSVTVATITGSEDEGYNADREITRQLELVLQTHKCDACIFVTDGASDERVIPIVQSRIKINGVSSVKMKQAESVENTYFTILEKLKEPHYSRIVFGLPAVFLLLFVISYLIGAGWVLPVALIGIYLLIKGFGLEDAFLGSFKGFGFSIEKMSFVFYLSALLFLVASIFIAAGNYATRLSITNNQGIALAYMLEGFLLLIPVVMILFLIGRIIDVRESRHVFRTFRYGIYIGSAIILWVLVYSFTEWFIGQIYFSQLINYTILAMVVGISVSFCSGFLRRKTLKSRNIKGKLVVNELGALIGKIAGTDLKRGRIIVNTSFGNPISYNIDRIVELSDKVVVK